jgi:hypothetical protein
VSVKATNWAWEKGRELGLNQGLRITLVRIGDHADNDGVCWPGAAGIAEYTGATPRTVRDHLGVLEGEFDLLHRERRSTREDGRGRATDRIVLHLSDLPAISSGGAPGDLPAAASGGTPQDQGEEFAGGSADLPETSARPTGGLKHDLPEAGDTGPYREPSVEPSENQKQTVDPVSEIYEFWKRATSRNGSTQLTAGRRTAVKARLDEGREVAFIKRAIANVATSPFHQGKNDQHRRYDDLTLICRNGEKLEQFAEMGGGSTGNASPAPRRPDGPVVETDRSKEAWESAKKALECSLPESTYAIWVGPFEVAGERDGKLVLVDSSDHGGISQWATRRYRKLFIDALGGAFGDVELLDEKQLELEAA